MVLGGDHPLGDFAFARYEWTQAEADAFVQFGRPPATVHDLPGIVSVVPVCLYTSSSEMSFLGPSLLSTQFRRLNVSAQGRLILFDLSGRDELREQRTLAVVPSTDICPTDTQRQILKRNLHVDHVKEFGERTPLLSYLLGNGLCTSDYVVGDCGDRNLTSWPCLWQLFDDFVRSTTVNHPQARPRSAQDFRCPLSAVHEQQWREELRVPKRAYSTKRKRSEAGIDDEEQETEARAGSVEGEVVEEL